MLRTAATRGRKDTVVSSWKLETSATTSASAGTSSACSESGVPMFPATSVGRDCAFSNSPVSVVVVVLPLVPVIAMTSASIAMNPSSSSPITGTPRALAAASAGRVDGTPGLTTTRSAPANASSGCPPAHTRHPLRSSCQTSDWSEAAGAESDARTRPPRLRMSRAAAMPLRARPTTDTVRSPSQRRKAGPRSLPSISSSSSTISDSAALITPRLLAKLQGCEGEQRHHERQDPEADDDLRFGPSLHLVVMVKRRHAEDASPEELEGDDLNDDGRGFHHVD